MPFLSPITYGTDTYCDAIVFFAPNFSFRLVFKIKCFVLFQMLLSLGVLPPIAFSPLLAPKCEILWAGVHFFTRAAVGNKQKVHRIKIENVLICEEGRA